MTSTGRRGATRIPTGDANWRSPPVALSFTVDAELVWMISHMHARGKDMTYTLTLPEGCTETALRANADLTSVISTKAIIESGA